METECVIKLNGNLVKGRQQKLAPQVQLTAAGEAQARYEECEASQGRPVPKASGASGARIASGKR